MDFALTPEQEKIRDTAERFLTEASDQKQVRAAMETKAGYDPQVWARIGGELGWCATHIPEEYGGLGLSWVELVLLMEQMGRRLLCAPFFSTVCLAATALLEAGDEPAKRRYLPDIAAGGLTATVALIDTSPDWSLDGVGATARRVGSGYVVDGCFSRVLDGAHAGLMLIPARIEGGSLGLFAIAGDAAGVRRTAHRTLDLTRRIADVSLEGVTADALVSEGARLTDGLTRAVALARIGLAAEQLGGAQQCLDLTLAYTAARVQFGRPVASFQAVKHRCAEMMVRVEAARSVVYGAAATAAARGSATDSIGLEAACARALVSETAFYCAQEAIQLHGGVGFTWDFEPHLHLKRAQAAMSWFGTPDAMRERVAAALLDSP
jgi:alkylation response protein AidB-like acyl-CoA dehydrogenase